MSLGSAGGDTGRISGRRPGGATFWVTRGFYPARRDTAPSSATTASAHESTEWPASTRCRSSMPTVARIRGPAAARSRPHGKVIRITASKPKSQGKASEERVEQRVAGNHRHTGSGRLVHDLVERVATLGLGGAEEHVGPSEQLGHALPRDGALESHALSQHGALGNDPVELVPVRLRPP